MIQLLGEDGAAELRDYTAHLDAVLAATADSLTQDTFEGGTPEVDPQRSKNS